MMERSLQYETEYFTQIKSAHESSVIFYRRSDRVKEICNDCIPEFHVVRCASDIRQVSRLLPVVFASQRTAMIVAEVDHTIVKFMETIHKFYENEKKMSAKFPLLLLVPEEVDDDLRQYVEFSEDANFILENQFSSKDVFERMMIILHRRHASDELYRKVCKGRTFNCNSESKDTDAGVVAPELSSCFLEELDEEELTSEVLAAAAGVGISTYLDSSKKLLPTDVFKMREYYIRELRRQNKFEILDKYLIDAHERGKIDDMILFNLKGGAAFAKTSAGKNYQTLNIEESIEEKETAGVKRGDSSRTIMNKPMKLQGDTCNLLNETTRPSFEENGSTQSSLFSANLLPFVDRPRPAMTRPRTVGGLLQKNAKACWKVMRTKENLIKEVQPTHERQWLSNAKGSKKTVKPVTDDQGTMTIETFLKIKDQLIKLDSMSSKVMEEAVPVDTIWERPVYQRKSSEQKKEEFNRDLQKTKRVLKKSGRKPSNACKNPKLMRKASSTCSLPEDDVFSDKSTEGDSREFALGALRGWRGLAESISFSESHEDSSQFRSQSGNFDDSLNKKQPATSKTRKLSTMLRSSGGINFGNIVVGAKAREKAKRMVTSMSAAAYPVRETSKLIWVNLDNRRVSAYDRDNLAGGIGHLSNKNYEEALKCFSKAIMVCKQVHIAMIYRGIVQYCRGKFFEALRDFTNASKNIESSNILIKNHMEDILITRFNRGMTFLRLGEDSQGIKDLKFALEVNPSNIHIRNVLMQVQRRSSNYIEAIEHCIQIKNAEDEKAMPVIDMPSKPSSKKDSLDVVKSPFSSTRDNTSRTSKRGINNFDGIDFGSTLSSDAAMRPKAIDMVVKDPENCFPGLKERKENFLSMKVEESSTQNVMFLDTFKHAHGYKRDMFDTHFVRPSDLQSALIQTPPARSDKHKLLIGKILKNYPILNSFNESKLYEVASCVEYRAVNSQSIIFYQGDPVDAVVMVLSGQLQLRMESEGGREISAVISELNGHDMYGHFSCIFDKSNTKFLSNLRKMCQDAENGIRAKFTPQNLGEDEAMEDIPASEEADLPRALQPGGFMTCKVSVPTEMILMKKDDFHRLVRRSTELEFFRRLELLKSSGVFGGDFSYYDLVRLGRMCVPRRFKQGETILAQGDVPDFFYFILKGGCKAMKRPDPTEYLRQRLKELRDKVDVYDEQYTFHHSLRFSAESPTALTRTGTHLASIEKEHMQLKEEIVRLEIQEAREVVLEKKRIQEEKELIKLGHEVPDRFVEISSLQWPQVFGEAVLLQPDTGVSAGSIVADTNCELLCLHKSHLRTFDITTEILDNLRERSVVYPPHEKLVLKLADKEEWVKYRADTLEHISKEKWPGCRAAKPQAFNV